MKQMTTPEKSPGIKELGLVQDITGQMMITMRNFSLYPEKHSSCTQSLAALKRLVNLFLSGHDSLRFDVRNTQLLYCDTVVHQGADVLKNPAFILFRDGLLWFEFHRGITSDELSGFISIINENRIPDEMPEGDVVTALWNLNPPHIRYEVSDVIWESEPLIDFSVLRLLDKNHGEESDPKQALDPVDPSLLPLTPEDRKSIEKLIDEDYHRDRNADMMDMLEILLDRSTPGKEDLSLILEAIKLELQSLMTDGSYRKFFDIMASLHCTCRMWQTEKAWAVPLLDSMFEEIFTQSDADTFIAGLLTLLMKGRIDIPGMRILLLYLPTDAFLSLSLKMIKLNVPWIAPAIVDALDHYSRKTNTSLLRRVLDSNTGDMERWISILSQLDVKAAYGILVRLTRHGCDTIRIKTLNALAGRSDLMISDIFHLIDDPHNTVRLKTLEVLGSKRDPQTESLMLDYLGNRRYKISDHRHLSACYRILGQCGSDRCLPFAREVVFGNGLNRIAGFGRLTHRRGALLALMAHGSREADEIVKKASRSYFFGIRRAYQKALRDCL